MMKENGIADQQTSGDMSASAFGALRIAGAEEEEEDDDLGDFVDEIPLVEGLQD
jgi:hypothetical protein